MPAMKPTFKKKTSTRPAADESANGLCSKIPHRASLLAAEVATNLRQHEKIHDTTQHRKAKKHEKIRHDMAQESTVRSRQSERQDNTERQTNGGQNQKGT